MNRAVLAGAVAVGLVGDGASADVVHFTNPAPGQPGHYDWRFDWWTLEPSWLDITRSPSDQPNVPGGAAVGQLFVGEGDADYNAHWDGAQLLAVPTWGGWSFTQYLVEGDPIAPMFPHVWSDTSAHAAASFGGPHSSLFPSGATGFMGVRTRAGQLGWIKAVFEVDDLNFRALEWAYETEPGLPIRAGEVPSPGGAVVLTLGSITVLRRRSS
ncbi:MAG: hypothetical protein IT436_04095 [Phycisphaerales bacterium]|nr:hypothetical protein [Phycisphaerales bacterium]